jgi:type IV pilus assembly protein PilW
MLVALKALPSRHRHAGLSLVELLVGLALGLFVLAGAVGLLGSQLSENRHRVLETRLDQDLRAAALAIERDLRRAGHWGEASAGVWREGWPVQANPYPAMTPERGVSDALRLRYSRDSTENHRVDANEEFGFRLRNQGIDILLGDGGWQALTDPETLSVTALRITPQQTELEAPAPCARPCPPAEPGAATCPPRVLVRHYQVEIAARSPVQPQLERRVSTHVRVRNDAVSGRCPA